MSYNSVNSFGMDIEVIYADFIENLDKMIDEIDLFVEKAEKRNSILNNKQFLNALKQIEIHKDFISNRFKLFFQENKEYILYNLIGKTFITYLIETRGVLASVGEEISVADLNKVTISIQTLVQIYFTIFNIVDNDNKAKELIGKLETQVERATKSALNIESARLALEAGGTDEIYLELSEKYEEEYDSNNKYFRNSLTITIIFTVFSIIYTFNIPIDEINWPVFISTKILILAVGITLCTLFLRRSTHAKKMHEKAYQTHVEINAYPIFIKSLKDEDQQEITKELALRYFGNDIDQTQNDKIGDLVQDQLSAGTELIRASAEMVKIKSEGDSNR